MEISLDNDPIRDEFERWCKYFGDNDQYESNETVGILDVLRAHFLIADFFYGEGYGIAGVGPRDPDLLHSAVYRQFVSFGGKDKWATPFERCATLLFGLVKDHPFHDANKRTGLLVMLFFLSKMGRVPTVKQKELEDFVVDIAEDRLRKYRRQQELLRKSVDPEILFIADYLRRNSRARDSKYYAITYRELDNRLRQFGYCLANPHNNYIDVCRIEEKRKLLGIGKKETKLVKLAQIGFPSWKKTVGKGAIKTVRTSTGLIPKNGVDSATFYHGVDPLNALISDYEKPLERLAYR